MSRLFAPGQIDSTHMFAVTYNFGRVKVLAWYFIYSALIEGLALAPVAISGIGHAGPNGGILGLISFLLNLPGILCVLWLAQYWDFSWARVVIAVFVIQTALLGC